MPDFNQNDINRLRIQAEVAATKREEAFRVYEVALKLVGGCLKQVTHWGNVKRCSDFFGTPSSASQGWCTNCRATVNRWLEYRHRTALEISIQNRLKHKLRP